MLLKIISIVGSFTFLSRILGYSRDLLIARVLGAGLISDCFFIAFKLPNLFRRLFGEGAMNSAFIPVVSGINAKSGKRQSDDFFSKIFSILLVSLFLFLLIVEIFMPVIINIIAPGFVENPEKFKLSVEFSRLSFPFVFFVCLTSLMGAYLNTLGRFAAMAVTPIILNLTMISVLVFFFKVEDKIYISNFLSFSISLAGILQVFWMYFNLKNSNTQLSINWGIGKLKKGNRETSKFFKLLIPAIIGNGAYQLNLLIDMILASTLPDGSVSYLYYADRVNQLPLGVLGIAISTALLPVLSNQIKNNEKKEANKSISSAIKFGIIFSVPAFVGLFILSDEIIRFLFYRGAFELSDVGLTSSALVALCCGLPAFVMIKILVVPFFANEDTKTPIKVSIFCMVINLILNLILIKEFFHVGLAISTSVSAWINAIILGCILKKELKFSFNKSIFAVLIKVIISSLLMGCAILGLIDMSIMNFTEHSFFDKNLTLITCITFGMAIYFVSIYVLGVKELKMGKWKKKKKTTN